MAQTAEIIQFGARRKKVRGKSDAIDGGWVKSYRKRLKEEFSHCVVKYAVFDFLLLNATHKPFETRIGAKPITLMPGQLITSQPKILEQFSKSVVRVTIDHVRGALDFFIREGMITTEGTRKGTIFTIVNWAKYQGEIEPKNTDFAPRQIPDTKAHRKPVNTRLWAMLSPTHSPTHNRTHSPLYKKTINILLNIVVIPLLSQLTLRRA